MNRQAIAEDVLVTTELEVQDEKAIDIFCWRMEQLLEAGYARAVQGEADNPKMLQFGQVVLDLARGAGDLAARAG